MEYSKEIKLFADCHCTLSESPMWNDAEQLMYWRGFEGELYRKAIGTPPDEYECFRLNVGLIGSMVFTDAGYMLLFCEKGKIWRWVPGEEPVLHRDFGMDLFNDVIVDPKGRIYCGMLAKDFFGPGPMGEHGSFWRLDPDGSFICLDKDIGTTPNGIRFSPDLTRLYFGVTDDDVIYVYDYDVETGELSNRRICANNCCPDGIAMDTDGNIWNTNCTPGMPLQCITPNGEVIKEYDFPVRRVISVCFGGNDRSIMFITTAHEGEPRGEHDGGVFMIEGAAKGTEEYILHC